MKTQQKHNSYELVIVIIIFNIIFYLTPPPPPPPPNYRIGNNIHSSCHSKKNKNDKNIFKKNVRTCRDIKTEKACKRDWDSTSA